MKMINVSKIEKAKVLLARRAPKLGRAVRGIKICVDTNPLIMKGTLGDLCARMVSKRRGGIREFFTKPKWYNSQSVEMVAYAMGFLQLACNDKKTVALSQSVRNSDDRQRLVVSYNAVIRKRLDRFMPRPGVDREYEEKMAQWSGVPIEKITQYDETPPLYHVVREATRDRV